MAKELPYFKFEPNQWENGNIQMLSREDKGLFVDLCSMYWSRLGDVPLKLAIQKLCGGNVTALNSLCDEKIIEVIDGNIFINFLSEQLNEFDDISKQNSKNAKEGWEKRRKQKEESERNATALISQCENDAIREDKSKEDNIILKNKPTKNKFDFKKSLLDYGFKESLVEDWLIVRKEKKASNTETSFNSFISMIEKNKCDINFLLGYIISKSWSGFNWRWVENNNDMKLFNSDLKKNEMLPSNVIEVNGVKRMKTPY